MDDEKSVLQFSPVDYADCLQSRFYKFVEDAYSYANRTLLQLLLKDQQLIPRLRSLKRYFFLSQSSFLTHMLDLSHTELRKSAKSASIIKLQSLLDLALNTDAHGEDLLFREDVKVTMAGSGLYDWLLKVISVSGVIGEEGGPGDAGMEESKKEKEKDKDDKKPMLGKAHGHLFRLFHLISNQLSMRWLLITPSSSPSLSLSHEKPSFATNFCSGSSCISNMSSNLCRPCGSSKRRHHGDAQFLIIPSLTNGACVCFCSVHECWHSYSRSWRLPHSRSWNLTGACWRLNLPKSLRWTSC
jgi:Gamma tubulin complex component C-terminal